VIPISLIDEIKKNNPDACGCCKGKLHQGKKEEIKWSDVLMRKFNGEVRQRGMGYFDAQEAISEKESA